MALVHVNFIGKSIGLQSAMTVILPDQGVGGDGPFPVFYLLHGLSDDHNAWTRRTSIERYVEGLPLIVVMPATGRGWYTNSAKNPWAAYEDHIIKDVVGFVDRMFPTIRERDGRVIGGLSMGGYGALKLGLKYPEMFCSAVSHSGAVMTALHKSETRPKELQPYHAEFEAIFGADWRGGANDTCALAAKCPKELRPALRMDCGVADFLLEQNREMHAHLDSIGYPHEYEEFPADPGWLYFGPLNRWTGAHDWATWDFAVQKALLFHCRVLGIPVPAVAQRPGGA